MTDSAIVSLITFFTLVATNLFSIYRDKRNRRWADEDRARIAAVTHTAIAENTQISKDAFHEANSVNLKIASLGIDNNARLEKLEDDSSREKHQE